MISLGDPCGIGPEIISKAWLQKATLPLPPFCVMGDASVLEQTGAKVHRIESADRAQAHFSESIPVLDRPLKYSAVPGKPDPGHGSAIIDWIKEAVDLCLSGHCRGLITAPIAKSILYQAGFSFPGHTEFIDHLTRQAPYPYAARGAVMMLSGRDTDIKANLRVALATIHIPLAKVSSTLDVIEIERIIRVTHQALRDDFGIAAPRLALCGLNPHAGESGQIGTEEIHLLSPLVARMAGEIFITGPHPADSLFHPAARKTYDAAICLYHDQGLIPLKMLDFWGGVNITIGLPIIRTSPDHGTGFDIAGQGLARPDSLCEAIKCADALSRQRSMTELNA